MLPLHSFVRNSALALVLSLLHASAWAQDPPVPESPEAIRAAIAQHRTGITVADSTGDIATAIRLRMTLAALSKPKEAQALYEQVVHLADSTARTEEELAARHALARTLAARGHTEQAYEQAILVADRSAEWAVEQAEISGAEADAIAKRAALERDSLSTLADAGRREAELRINEANENAEFWMLLTVGAIAISLISIVLVLLMNARALRRHRSEIQALRSDLSALIDRAQNKVREPTAPPEVLPAPVSPRVAPVAEPGHPPVVVDPVLEAMFRKQAPERLVTLRDARSRGDHEKVQRVVHTLKPQLVNFDPSLAQLCARIMEAGAPNDAQRWNADMEAFEKAVSRLLA